MRWVGLLVSLGAVACSGSPQGEVVGEPRQPEGGTVAAPTPTARAPSAYVIGDKEPLGPIPGQCVPGCKLAFPSTSNATSMHCYQLGDGACQAEPGGWFSTVPGCGEVGLWLVGCSWTGSYCTAGELFEAWNACMP